MSMRIRQKAYQKLYPRWSKQDSPARRCKARDGMRCVSCQIEDRTLIKDTEGNPLYILYLHAAHVHPLDPTYWTTEPIEGQRLKALCPSCHRLYDLAWQQRAEEVEHQCTLHGILRHRWLMNRFVRVV